MSSSWSSKSLGLSVGALVLVILSALSATAGSGDSSEGVATGSELKIHETTIDVRVRIECRRYEGKVLNCTFDPSRVAGDAVEMRLLLGYADVTIDGTRLKLERDKGTAVKFRPRGEARLKDFSGERVVKLSVVYVK